MSNITDKNDKIERLKTFYNLARLAGVADNQKDFADFLSIHEQTISKAFNGCDRYLTEKLLRKIEIKLTESGINLESPLVAAPITNTAIGDNSMQNINGDQNQNGVPHTTIESIIAEMQAQREMHDRQISELLRQNSQLINIITNTKN